MTFEEYDKVTELVLGIDLKIIDKDKPPFCREHAIYEKGYERCKQDIINELTKKLWPYIDKEDLENGKNG